MIRIPIKYDILGLQYRSICFLRQFVINIYTHRVILHKYYITNLFELFQHRLQLECYIVSAFELEDQITPLRIYSALDRLKPRRYIENRIEINVILC